MSNGCVMREPDIVAEISFLKTEEGGRLNPVSSRYRPAHSVRDDYLTTGQHDYSDKQKVFPGESVVGTITFLSPEAYPHCLWEGKILSVQEGSRIVGYAKVITVLNELLRLEE